MRISSNLFFQTGLNSINAQQSDLMHLYQQIGSGKRMVTPSDDPLGAAQAVNIRQAQSLNTRFGANREVATRNLGTEENALSSMTTLMQELKTQLVAAGNGTLSDADRATLSNVLQNARSSMLGFANTTDGSGQYLFSGAKGGTAAFQEVNGKIVYMGDAGQRKIQADQTSQIAGSDVGSDIFNRAAPGTTSYLTRSVAGNGGTAVMSTPTITDPAGNNVGKTFSVKFSATVPNEYTIEINDAAGSATTIVGPNLYDPNAGTLDLTGGVQVKLSGAPALGDSFVIEPANSPDYVALADAANTSGATVSSPSVYDYSVTRPGDVFTIEFTAPDKYRVTVDNAAYTPASETFPVQDFVPGRENTLTLPYGMQVKVSGTPVAVPTADKFTVQAAAAGTKTDLNMFDTLDSIIDALKNPMENDPIATAAFQNTLATAMQRLDVNYNNVLTVRSSVGARMNQIDAISSNGAARSLSYSAQLSQLEDVDYYTASAQLQLRTAALEAAALAFKKIQSTSLFNMKG